MAVKTPKTLVLKTELVGSVKLPTPAERIGRGLAVDATYPAVVLSSGQFPLPHDPGSEPNPGSRQVLSATQLREQMRVVVPVAAPAGPAGRLVRGPSAHRRPASISRHLETRWHRKSTKRPTAFGTPSTATGIVAGAVAGTPGAVRSGASFRAAFSLENRFGSDCQSPDRHDDRWLATTEAAPPAAAGK